MRERSPGHYDLRVYGAANKQDAVHKDLGADWSTRFALAVRGTLRPNKWERSARVSQVVQGAA